MKNILRVVFVVSCAVLLSGPAFAQQPVAPPPQPADNGPSLAATMQFIQTKLQERGRLSYPIYVHDHADGKDAIHQSSGDLSNIVADPATCRINYHLNLRMDGDAPPSTCGSAFTMCRT
jgi:hypothetical protein